MTTELQARGHIGNSTNTESHETIRGIFQAPESLLPGDALQFCHVPGHCGEPWNELCDYLAKLEIRKSQYFRRPHLTMRTWRPALSYLWMIFSQHDGLPQFCGDGFHVPPPLLPEQQQAQPVVALTLSLCTANVNSLSLGPDGHRGKLDYLRKQFIHLGLNILGIQEARTPSSHTFVDQLVRLTSGSHGKQLGAELWVNTSQPCGRCGKKALYFKREHFQVVHKDPRARCRRQWMSTGRCRRQWMSTGRRGRHTHRWWSASRQPRPGHGSCLCRPNHARRIDRWVRWKESTHIRRLWCVPMDPFRCPHHTDKLIEVSADSLKTALKTLFKPITLSLDLFPNIVHAVCPYFDAWFLVGHAPHSGIDEDIRTAWWSHFTELGVRRPSWDTALCHGRCGMQLLEIGTARSSCEMNLSKSLSTPLWREFLQACHLGLPCTSAVHAGELETWISPDGTTQHCIDYVAVDLALMDSGTFSSTVEDFDLGHAQWDHTATRFS